MSARSALVTGASGFIASHLVPALVAEGWDVRACGRRPRPPGLPAEADYRAVDLVDSPAIDELVGGVTHVFHLAGASSSRSSDEEMHRDNVVATERLFEALAAVGTVERALAVSTTAVYGEEEELPSPVPEGVQPRPSRGYGKAKWEAEQVVWRFAEKGMAVVVVRPVSVHGPGAVKLLASAILDVAIERFMGLDRLAVHGEPIEQRLVHVDDVVAACLHLMGHPDAVGRAFNVASGAYPISHEVAEILAAHFGMTVELDDDPDCGPGYPERQQARSDMLALGMNDPILLTRERFRFLRKANRNNRLSLDALEGTGFRFRHADPRRAVLADVDWYRRRRWILGPE
ncbi:MAG: NAD-dependent epimerase/dehydratase family protein [Acidimicrobiales bacterium]